VNGQQRARATHLLDTLDAVAEELAHWLSTGMFTVCARCGQKVPAADVAGAPVRHQLGRLGQPDVWCG